MKTIPLTEYLEEHGTQSELAAALGINQSAVSQMVRAGRSVHITVHEDGRIEAYEQRPVPARPKAGRPAA
ncbi:Cro/CI family transcriptional regulator [Pseudomonas sichuanensis]|uniref:helix-turn-helix domain-containing protein n=1 Tax=Pseudomonas sichuanensis TaxID=2213015 RepID=UPI00215E8F2E|nr:helix-turn-helix transcriptional regulator [Pseudomonas sichuanensis]UVK81281.1 Cro/CI family transcriptional regulator [Pseudomonas sichuanensis]